MNNLYSTYILDFDTLMVDILCYDRETFNVVDLLLCDLPKPPKVERGKTQVLRRNYTIYQDVKTKYFHLLDGETPLYHGNSTYHLAYQLINEILFHCISENHDQHALHSGAVHLDGCGIILPGASGNGKSTLTAWMCSNGFGYLTDELIFISHDGSMTPFTRPVNLKTREPILSPGFVKRNRDSLILSGSGESMLPHRLLNPTFSNEQKTITHIIFPKFQEGVGAELSIISSAKSCFQLLQSHVNARNLPFHGVSSLSEITRNCQSYNLVYSNFNEIGPLFKSLFNN